MSKGKRNWILDAALFAGFLSTFFLDWTGLSWHQWLGVMIGAAALYHIALHWNWVIATTQRLRSPTGRQNKVFYWIDISLFIGFILIGVTGLAISTWLSLELSHYQLWRDLHVYGSIASLLLILIKIAVHWRWIVKTASRYIGLWRTPAPVAVSAAGGSSARRTSINRREFLQLMGVASLGALISASNLVELSEAAGEEIIQDQTASSLIADTASQTSAGDCSVACNKGCSYPGQCGRYVDTNGNGICDLTECTTDSSQVSTSPTDESAETQSTLGDSALAENEEESAAGDESCVVLCSKGCAYPGGCHDYVDNNGNNLCDLGECLVSNMSITRSSSGRQHRRGN